MDTLEHTIYDSATLGGILESLDPPKTFFLDTFFKRTMTFTDRYIEFGRLSQHRTLAPFVMPLAQGRPVFKEEADRVRFAPGYVKPKDSVVAAQAFTPRPSSLAAGRIPTAAETFNATIVAILQKHLDAIVRREEWMAARAILDGQVILEGEDYPLALVDFDRSGDNTIVLGVGSRWNDPGVSIPDQLEAQRTLGRAQKFSGTFNKLILGLEAWAAARTNASLKDLLDTRYRGTTSSLNVLEPGSGMELEYKGNIGDIEVWVYSDWFEDADGNHIPLMNPKDALLCGPAVDGVRAYAAIADKGANFRPLPRFTKMWDQEDPSATFVLTQSAPLMVPTRPNNTMKITVVA